MKALILGAGGQVGRALAATAPAGVEVVALARAECDIANFQAVDEAVAAAQPELVLNAAAFTAVDKAETAEPQAWRLNAEAPGHLARAAARIGAHLVHVSTDFVFDGCDGTPRRPDDPTNPLGVYGRSKLAGEQAVREAAPDALIVRTAWVYAAPGANFVTTMLRLMAERPSIGVVADQVGTPTYAGSLARCLWALAERQASGIHHFTDAGVASWYDFAVAIQEEAAALGLVPAECVVRPITTADYPTPARRPAVAILDKGRTWDLLGDPPPHWRVNLRTCLRELSNG